MNAPTMTGFSLLVEQADDRDAEFSYDAELTIETARDIKTYRTSGRTCIAALEAVLLMAGQAGIIR